MLHMTAAVRGVQHPAAGRAQVPLQKQVPHPFLDQVELVLAVAPGSPTRLAFPCREGAL